jgi:hypothetical protein
MIKALRENLGLRVFIAQNVSEKKLADKRGLGYHVPLAQTAGDSRTEEFVALEEVVAAARTDAPGPMSPENVL